MPKPRRTSDATLVRRSQQGDRRAFSALLGRYDWRLRGLAHALLLSRSEMDVVLATAYLRAWRDVVRVDPKEDVAAWLYRVTYNACIDQLRRVESASSAAAGDAATLAAGGIAAGLATLPAAERVAVVLVDREGFSPGSAARILGLAESALTTTLDGARERLHAHIPAAADEPAAHEPASRDEPDEPDEPDEEVAQVDVEDGEPDLEVADAEPDVAIEDGEPDVEVEDAEPDDVDAADPVGLREPGTAPAADDEPGEDVSPADGAQGALATAPPPPDTAEVAPEGASAVADAGSPGNGPRPLEPSTTTPASSNGTSNGNGHADSPDAAKSNGDGANTNGNGTAAKANGSKDPDRNRGKGRRARRRAQHAAGQRLAEGPTASPDDAT